MTRPDAGRRTSGPDEQRSGRVLAVRLDSDGDVLLTGPAVRALAATADRVDLLAGPSGRHAAALLPGVDEVLLLDAPWSGYRPPAVDPEALRTTVADLGARGYDRCVIFTSFHQSPLPMALLARLAGIGWVAAASVDYPGSLLDLRHRRTDGLHEVEAALELALAAGGEFRDDGRLAVRTPLPDVDHLLPAAMRAKPYVVVHPGASVPARAMTPAHAGAVAAALVRAGHRVVVTGGSHERGLGAEVTPAAGSQDRVVDLSGRTTFAELAAVLRGAVATVVGNTGPAHLSAAVGTPVVSLFAPVVPAAQWAPYGVPSVVLGDQDAPCRGTRARECPVPGHPCLSDVGPQQVLDAVDALSGALSGGPAGARTGVAG